MTLLELMVVIAIAGILATMAVVELFYGTGRARLNNATWEIAALSSAAQMRAAGRGFPNYVVFYESVGETGVLHFERDERAGIVDPAWSAVDPTNPGTFAAGGVPVRVHERIRFTGAWGRGGMHFESLAGFSLAARPPYWAIPTMPAGASGLMAACSFCQAGANGSVIGAIRYAPDGTASVVTGPEAARLAGGAVALATDRPNEAGHPRLIAFSVPTGAVNVIYRD